MTKLPLLALPGLLNDERLWAHQVAGLAPEHAVTAVPTTSHDSVAALAAAALERAPPGRFALAGFSMGGYVALEIMRQAPQLEQMLVRSGIRLVKLWFSVSRAEQRTRFLIRQVDPVRQWKLSPTDLASLDKWDDYTAAKEAMFLHTDTDHAPWTTIKSNDKKRARLNAMRHFLSQFEYEDKDHEVVGTPDPLIVRRGREAVGD